MKMSSAWELPYGAYITRTDAILFNRRYQPICSVPWTHVLWPSGNLVIEPRPTIVAPDTRITFEAQRWFYNDGNSAYRCKATRDRLKRMVDAIPGLASEIKLRQQKAVRR